MFRLIQRIPQKYRIPLVAGVFPAIIIMIVALMQGSDIRNIAAADCKELAKAICVAAESVRSHAEYQWGADVFQQTVVKDWAKQGKSDLVLATVPIVSSMKSIEQSSKANNFQFRVDRKSVV